MISQPIKIESVEPRINGIQEDVAELQTLAGLDFEEFRKKGNFAHAQFYLRQALEGVFNIGSHFISRLPGGRSTEYAEIAKKLGEAGIVDRNFAEQNLKKMAGYRNRLTHLYAQVSAEELYGILANHLGDFDKFLQYAKAVLEHPEKFKLTVE